MRENKHQARADWEDFSQKYVRLTVRVGCPARTITTWAIKLGMGHYRKVDECGDWGSRGVDRRIIAQPQDIVSERKAQISRKYGTLEVV